MLKKILLILFTAASLSLSILSILVIIASRQPPNYRIQKQLEINAPVEKVFEMVNHLENWEKWSPWKAIDPEMIITLGEVNKGQGANYSWNGKIAGKGSMNIFEVLPNERIRLELHFELPVTGMARSDFLFVAQPENKSVIVTWGMDGENKTIIAKFFYRFTQFRFDLEKDFEMGLGRLKAASEAAPKKSP